jgi:membrane associated rhomboid family serine protease
MVIFQRYYPEKFTEEQVMVEKKILRHSLFFSVFLVVIIWLFFLVEQVYQFDFSHLGIYPSKLKGTIGILLSPLIHGSYGHIAANTVPLFLLTFTLFFFYRKPAYKILLLIYILSGICVWIGGRQAWHIGASGLIYGLAAFLILSGIIRNDIRLLTISLIIILIYGGLFWGIFPIKPEISWESHLWGSISGVVLAIIYRNEGPPKKMWVWNEEDEEEFSEGEPEQSMIDFPESEKN